MNKVKHRSRGDASNQLTGSEKEKTIENKRESGGQIDRKILGKVEWGAFLLGFVCLFEIEEKKWNFFRDISGEGSSAR